MAAVDCRNVLLAAVAELTPELRPVRTLLDACRDDPARFRMRCSGTALGQAGRGLPGGCAEPITVVPAGRAVGKSFLLAGIVLWWLYTRPMSLVITTGPDHRQVVSVLWKEIRRALRPRRGLGGRDSRGLVLGHDHLTAGYNSPQRLVVKMGTDWGALGFAAQYEEGFSGQHADDLLVIVDEASGVAAPIWSAIHGLAASRLVVAGTRSATTATSASSTTALEGLDDYHLGRHFEPRVARRPERRLPRRDGVADVLEPDARDSRRGVAVVAVEYPGHLPGSGVGAVPAGGLARRLHAGERAP